LKKRKLKQNPNPFFLAQNTKRNHPTINTLFLNGGIINRKLTAFSIAHKVTRTWIAIVECGLKIAGRYPFIAICCLFAKTAFAVICIFHIRLALVDS
jgi:uncharacterized membrane protein